MKRKIKSSESTANNRETAADAANEPDKVSKRVSQKEIRIEAKIDKRDPELLKVNPASCANQLADAKKEILERERDISLQAAVAGNLTGNIDWGENFRRLAETIDSFIPSDYFHVVFIRGGALPLSYSYKKLPAERWEKFDCLKEILEVTGWSEAEYIAIVGNIPDYIPLTPHIRNDEQTAAWADSNRLGKFMQQYYGYRSMLSLPFDCKNPKVLMIAYLASKNPHSYTEQHLDRMRRLASPLSLAMENLFAFEDIKRRDNEKSLQIAVADALNASGSWEEKFRRTAEIFASFLPWEDICFTFADVSFAKNVTFIKRENGEIYAPPLAETLRTLAITAAQVGQYLQQDAAHYEQPGFYVGAEYDEACKKYVWKRLGRDKFGFKSSIHVPLPVGDRGTMKIIASTKQENAYLQKHLDSLMKLAPPIGLAIEKLLAYEQLEQREREKALQLSISEAIAAVRHTNDLLSLIAEKFKFVFKFDAAVVVLLDEKEQTYSTFLLNSGDRAPEALEDYDVDASVRYSIEDGVTGAIIARRQPILFDTAEKAREHPDAPYLRQMVEAGMRQTLAVALRYQNRDIGILALNARRESSFSEAQVALFKSVTEQIAAAVSSIQASDEIERREAEKAILLGISKAISTIRGKEDLFRVIAQQIRPVFAFDDFVIALINADSQTHSVFLLEVGALTRRHELFDQTAVIEFPLADGIADQILSSDEPFVYNVHEKLDSCPKAGYLRFLHDVKIKQVMSIALRYQNRDIALLSLQSYNENNFSIGQSPLFKSVAEQVAVALHNILANEELERKLVEITGLKKQIEQDRTYLVEELENKYNHAEIIGTSPRLYRIFEAIEQVAPTDATILIQGETGTGKELIARAVHRRSPRNKRPLIKVNCATLPRELVESELFGHERGAFTGAHERRVGKFELANGSTIFLDEIGELPLELQIKLLRVLQEKVIERVGGKTVISLDIRVIAATNRNLQREVEEKNFRADLLYRLNTVTLELPPLRDRREDIEPLTMHFAQKYAAKFSRRIDSISNQTLKELNAYDFPGNIRELEHIVEQAVIFSKQNVLTLPRPLVSNGDGNAKQNGNALTNENFVIKPLEAVERDYLLRVLEETGGRVKGEGGAAELLGLNPSTLRFRLKKLGIERKYISQ